MRTGLGNLIGAPIVELVIWIYRTIKTLAYAKIEGRYFEYKGNPIEILEGELSDRWLSCSDVRRTLNALPRYSVLHRLYPSGTKTEGKLSKELIESRSLEEFLKKAQGQQSIRFLRWLQREVIFPAEKQNEIGG